MRDLLSIGTSRGCEMIGTGIGLGLAGYRWRTSSDIMPALDLQFADRKMISAVLGPTPSFSRASTGTYFTSSGLLTSAAVNGPRFDHVYSGGSWISKGLLVEEQRTNLCTYSEDFGNAAWNKPGGSVSTNQVSAPDGLTTADKFTENSGGGVHYILGSAGSIANSTIFSVSAYVKKGDRKYVYLNVNDGTSARLRYTVIFDLDLGQMANEYSIGSPTNSGYSIVEYGNGWFRISARIQTGSSQIYACELAIGMSDSATPTGRSYTNPTYTGNGSSHFYCWGVQSESGSFPTSYIPATTAAVTRSADVCQITGTDFSGFYNASEGSFVAEYDRIGVDNSKDSEVFQVTNSGGGNQYYLDGAVGNEFSLFYTGTAQANLALGSTPLAGVFAKTSIGYRVNDFAASRDGGSVVTDTSGTIPTVDRMGIGRDVASNNFSLNGHISRLRYYNSRLANSKLQELST